MTFAAVAAIDPTINAIRIAHALSDRTSPPPALAHQDDATGDGRALMEHPDEIKTAREAARVAQAQRAASGLVHRDQLREYSTPGHVEHLQGGRAWFGQRGEDGESALPLRGRNGEREPDIVVGRDVDRSLDHLDRIRANERSAIDHLSLELRDRPGKAHLARGEGNYQIVDPVPVHVLEARRGVPFAARRLEGSRESHRRQVHAVRIEESMPEDRRLDRLARAEVDGVVGPRLDVYRDGHRIAAVAIGADLSVRTGRP